MNTYKWRTPYSGFKFGGTLTNAVKALIIINVGVFVLVHLFSAFGWRYLFGMVPSFVFSRLMLWQLVTYMFLHVGLWHLAVNMLMLWLFGPAIESAWGRKRFLFYYFFTGIGAGLCSFITGLGSDIPVVGASGAIFGILVAYAMMYPETVILLFFIFPMKIKQAVVVLAGINLLGAVSSPGSGIAYFAHLGGALFGYLYLRSEWLHRKIFYLSDHIFIAGKRKRPGQRRQVSQREIDEQVDLILDKISKYGIESLTKKERQILQIRSKRK